MAARFRTCEDREAGPAPQLKPTASGANDSTIASMASGVWPLSNRPDASLRVSESTTGVSVPEAWRARAMPWSCALTFKASNAVSSSRRSTPPSIRAEACWNAASESVSKSTERLVGSSTSQGSEADMAVGPIEPATKQTLPGCSCIARSASSRASRAPAVLSSLT